MKWRILGCLGLVVVLAIGAGCKRKSRYIFIGEGEVVPTESAPKVIDRSPDRLERDVDLGAEIVVRFDRPLEESTVTSESFVVTGYEGDIPGTFEIVPLNGLPGGTDVIFRPSWPLGLTAEYSVRLTREIRSIEGVRLAGEEAWSFRTGDGDFQGSESIDPDVNLTARPTIALDDLGGGVLSWYGVIGGLGGQSEIFVRHLDPSGELGVAIPLAEDPGATVVSPDLSVNRIGEAIVAWERQGDDDSRSILVRRWIPGGEWTEAIAIDDPSEDRPTSPSCRMLPGGQAWVMWTTELEGGAGDAVHARFYDPQEGWGELDIVYEGEDIPDSLATSASSSGHAIVLWADVQGGEVDLWGSVFDSDGGWSIAERLDSEPAQPSVPDFRLGTDGEALVVWSQVGDDGEAIWWNRFEPENGWTGATQFPLDTALARRPRLDRAPNGDVVAVWQTVDLPPAPVGQLMVSRHSDRQWSTPEVAVREELYPLAAPQIGIDAAGEIVLAYLRQVTPTLSDVCSVRSGEVAGSWTTPQVLEHGYDLTRDVRLRVDARGNAIALWQRRNGSIFEIVASRFRRDGSWLNEVMISGQSIRIVLDMDASGRVAITWLGPALGQLQAQVQAHLFR
ncbi:MAG: Ig-like domain-containing protein [Planctomycetota bacterium]